MKKHGLVQELARRSGSSPVDAADRMARVVDQIVRTLRRGQAARLPGLGTIKPGKNWTFDPEQNER